MSFRNTIKQPTKAATIANQKIEKDFLANIILKEAQMAWLYPWWLTASYQRTRIPLWTTPLLSWSLGNFMS